jgi:hypothetical protein
MLLQKGNIVAEGSPADVVALHVENSAKARAARDAEIAKALAGTSLPVR